jgi:hypothetical protein
MEVTQDQFAETFNPQGEKRTRDLDPEEILNQEFESIGAPPRKSGAARRTRDDPFGSDGAGDDFDCSGLQLVDC